MAARELDHDAAFAKLAKEAEASPPGANGLVMLPYFSGERTPIHDPDAKGMIFGLNLTHDRGDLYRALLEGIAFGTNHIIETYREIGGDAEEAAGRRRRHQEPRCGRRRRPTSPGMAQTLCAQHHGRQLRRRVPGSTCRRRRAQKRYPRLESGSTGGSRHGSGTAPSTKSSTVCSRSFIREPGI